MDVVEIDELSGGELLDHAEDLATTRDRLEVDILRVAVQHAYLHHRDTLDPAETGKPGRERARRIGGAGTPEVTEFAAAELAGRLGVSTISSGMLMADGLDLCTGCRSCGRGSRPARCGFTWPGWSRGRPAT